MRSFQEFVALVANKRVAVIGNAQSFNEIDVNLDAFQLILRMNSGPFSDEGIEKDTDILCVSKLHMCSDRHLAIAENVVWMTPKHRDDLSLDLAGRLFFYPVPWWDTLYELIGSRPSTGCMVVDLISRTLDQGSCTLFGYDFWKSPTNYTKECRPGPHDPIAEESYIVEKVQLGRLAIG